MGAARTRLTWLILASGLGITSPSWAQEQIKPYFLLIFDTSGSMAENAAGVNVGDTNAASKMYLGKTAVLNIVNSTGDAVFGLERYQQSCGPGNTGCSCSGTNGACDDGRNHGEILVGIYEDNQPWILEFCDHDSGAACDYNGADNLTRWNTGDDNIPELRANGATPLATSLDEAQTYFQSGVLNRWGDAILGDGDNTLEANERWVSPITTDHAAVPPVDQCRPYAVILLTDGIETCGGTPATEATQLRSTWVNHDGDGVQDANELYDVLTYVIAFGVAEPNASIEAIAEAGGTDNMGDGAGGSNAFYPTDDVELAAALSDIIQDSLLVETCNSADDDCDTLIDEGVTNACDDRADLHDVPPAGSCGPVVELCDGPPGTDEDCDGEINEGFTLYCNRPGGHAARDLCVNPGETVCDGIDDNCNGVIDEGGVCGGCAPSAEICDGIDNDCDALIDEGLVRACGTDVGECTVGQQVCQAGVWGDPPGGGFVAGDCSGVDPVAELCNNLDDDCNGVIDGQVEPCGSDVGECQHGNRRCNAGVFGACVGEIGPVAEICDGLDNDCDGVNDDGNPGGGAACGSDVGECSEGVYTCVGGALVCNDVGPTPEVCDGLDNDCDGIVDDGNPDGGGDCGLDDTGECEDGVEQCVGGEVVCIGGVGPIGEVCDGLDNDCDGVADDGNPGGGGACGTDEGECEPGVLDCIGGALDCVGEVGPTDEICDGLDNDCDGATDEGIPIGAPCGSDVGECEPGSIECVDGVEDCVGGVGPIDEICNGLDDDCDGATDEGLGLGEACGTEEGLCEPGAFECIDGEVICVGKVGPTDETCDCDDEDCDGEVDEDPGICPGGSNCIDCSCRSPCDPHAEFSCPAGLHCECPEDLDGDGECEVGEAFCLGDRCEGVECEEPLFCDRSTGECADRCAGRVCDDGLRCDPRTGACAPDDCYNFPEDCADDEACIDADCAPHPCNGVDCEAEQYCRDGDCVGFCDDVHCPNGQHCVDGACVPDLCADTDCPRGDWCNPENGQCEDDQCDHACPIGRICDHANGECVDDPCLVTICPEAYRCDDGVCSRDDGGSDADVDSDSDVDTSPRKGLATGGGGCVCTAPGTGPGRGGMGGFALGVLLLGSVLVWRRRGR